MSTKKTPAGVLTIDDRFYPKVKKFWSRWKGRKPDLRQAGVIASLAYATMGGDASAFTVFKRKYPHADNVPDSEPHSALEYVMLMLLKFPDFSLALLTELRKPKNLAQYDQVDAALFRASAAGELDSIDDAEILSRARGNGPQLANMSDDGVKLRRQRWTKNQSTRRREMFADLKAKHPKAAKSAKARDRKR